MLTEFLEEGPIEISRNQKNQLAESLDLALQNSNRELRRAKQIWRSSRSTIRDPEWSLFPQALFVETTLADLRSGITETPVPGSKQAFASPFWMACAYPKDNLEKFKIAIKVNVTPRYTDYQSGPLSIFSHHYNASHRAVEGFEHEISHGINNLCRLIFYGTEKVPLGYNKSQNWLCPEVLSEGYAVVNSLPVPSMEIRVWNNMVPHAPFLFEISMIAKEKGKNNLGDEIFDNYMFQSPSAGLENIGKYLFMRSQKIGAYLSIIGIRRGLSPEDLALSLIDKVVYFTEDEVAESSPKQIGLKSETARFPELLTLENHLIMLEAAQFFFENWQQAAHLANHISSLPTARGYEEFQPGHDVGELNNALYQFILGDKNWQKQLKAYYENMVAKIADSDLVKHIIYVSNPRTKFMPARIGHNLNGNPYQNIIDHANYRRAITQK